MCHSLTDSRHWMFPTTYCRDSNRCHSTFQPLDLGLDWYDGFEWWDAQFEAGSCQGLYKELHGVVEGQLVVEGSHIVIIVEWWLLPVSHIGGLGGPVSRGSFREREEDGVWPRKRVRGRGAARHCHHRYTSCKMTTAVERKTKNVAT